MSEEQRCFDDFVLLEQTKSNISKMDLQSLLQLFCFCSDRIKELESEKKFKKK